VRCSVGRNRARIQENQIKCGVLRIRIHSTERSKGYWSCKEVYFGVIYNYKLLIALFPCKFRIRILIPDLLLGRFLKRVLHNVRNLAVDIDLQLPIRENLHTKFNLPIQKGLEHEI
jgi:hypothetical protein